MTAADKIAAARALIEPLTGHTPGKWRNGDVRFGGRSQLVLHSQGNGYVCEVKTPVRDNEHDYSVLEANVSLIAAAPALRDTVAELTDLADAQAQEVAEWRDEYRAVQGMNELLQAANGKLIAERDAQAQENARLRGLLWYAWHEFNAIRARDGAPRGADTCCGRLGPTLVSEEWWNTLTEAFADAIGTDARTPWPSPEAKDVGEALKATP